MNALGPPQQERPLAEPREMAVFLDDHPITSSLPTIWGDVTLQRFRHLPTVIDLPAMRDEVLVCHLGGPFLAETNIGTPNYQRRWIGPGQLGVNPAGLPVRCEFKGRPDVVLLHIPSARLRGVAEETFGIDPASVELVPTLAETDQTAERLILLLLREATSPEPGSPLMVESLIRAVIVHTLRRHSNLSLLRTEPLARLSPGRMRRVIEHMRTHLDRTLPVADLSAIAGMSGAHFTRSFRAATGQPPHRFLTEMRTEEACRLLEQTDLPIAEVGLRCGFDQPSHFATVFRKTMGMSPGTWRRERLA